MERKATAPPSSPATRAVFARHAASLILVRGGTHVLMGMRGARHRFMPHRLVFPGGSVDPDDGSRPATTELRPGTATLLGRAARPRLVRALAIAAARELQEETGLSLGEPPALDGLDYLCRAITPPDQPIRFNARFLVVDAARVTGELAGSGELEGLAWFGITDALAMDLALVTREVLGQLVEFLAAGLDARQTRDRTPVFRRRSWKWE